MFNPGRPIAAADVDYIVEADLFERERMEFGSILLLERIRLARGEDIKVRANRRVPVQKFGYVEHRNGNTYGAKPGCETRSRSSSKLAATLERKAFVETIRVAPRDPCPLCGVRGDVGCKHQ